MWSKTKRRDLLEFRRNIVDMLFVEGNHFCMFCEKSGNCELQAMAYRFGITAPKYPYQFPKRKIDASHPDIFIDHNRCILCARCVRASKRSRRQKRVPVRRPRQAQAHLGQRQAKWDTDIDVTDKAVTTCPVGAILKKRRLRDSGRTAQIRSRADRHRYRSKQTTAQVSVGGYHGKTQSCNTSLAGCFGCHMSILDIDERILELIELMTSTSRPINDIKEFTGRARRHRRRRLLQRGKRARAAGFPQALRHPHLRRRLRHQRRTPAMRNTIPLKECLEEAYLNGPTVYNPSGRIPNDPEIPCCSTRCIPATRW
jgi:ferredoxin